MTRIKEIHIYQCSLPVKGPPYRMALEEVTSLDTTLVEIVGENGRVGYGETCPLGRVYQPAFPEGARAALNVMAPFLVGLNVLEMQSITRQMNAVLAGHDYAKAAIDIAIWDLAGRTLGQKTCDLLGGAVRQSVPSYYAIGIDTPDNVARHAVEKQRQGYKRLQIKIGGRDLEEEIEVVQKVFERKAKNTRIVLDANKSLSTRDAILLSNSCATHDFILEQPCQTYEEIKSLRGKISHPIYLDESATGLKEIIQSIHDEVADGFGLKMTRVGGLSAMRTIRDLCQASQRPFSCDDSWGGDIIAAACVHMGATVDPKLLEGVWIADSYIEGNYDQTNPVRVVDGKIPLPDGHGLGIEPDKSNWTLVSSHS